MSSRRSPGSAGTSEQKKRRRAADEEVNEQSSARRSATKRRRNSISTISVHDQLVERAAHHRPETRHRPGSDDMPILEPPDELFEKARPAPERGRKARQSSTAASAAIVSPISETSSSRRKSITVATPKQTKGSRARMSTGAASAATSRAAPVRTPRPPFAAPVGIDAPARHPPLHSQVSISTGRGTISLQSQLEGGVSAHRNAIPIPVPDDTVVAHDEVQVPPQESPRLPVPTPPSPKAIHWIWAYLAIVTVACIALYVAGSMFRDTGTHLAYIMNNTTCRISSWGDGEEWKCGVPKEQVSIVQHAEEVLQQQRDALNHWRSRHYGTIEPALGRIERHIESIRKSTMEVMSRRVNMGIRAGSSASEISAISWTDGDSGASELHQKISGLVDSVSSYVTELEKVFAANIVGAEEKGQELPSLDSADCVLFRTKGVGIDLYYQCLLDKVQSSILRINSLHNNALPTSSPIITPREPSAPTVELQAKVNTILEDAATLSHGLNVRIAVDDNTLKSIETAAVAAVQNRMVHISHTDDEGSSSKDTDHTTAADRYEDNAEDASPSSTAGDLVGVSNNEVFDMLQSKIEAAAAEFLNATLSADGDYSAVRAALGAAVDRAVEGHSDAVKVHMDAVRAYLSNATTTLPFDLVSSSTTDGMNKATETVSVHDAGGEVSNRERLVDDSIAKVLVSVDDDIDEAVKYAVDRAVKEILQSTNARAATALDRDDSTIVKSDSEIRDVFAGVAMSRRQRLLEDEELTRAAYYAEGNLDIGALFGERGNKTPNHDFEEVRVHAPSPLLKSYVNYAVGPRGGKVFVHPLHVPVVISSSDEQRSEHLLTASPYRASSGVVSSVLFHSGFDISQSDPNAVLSHRMPPDIGHCYAFAGTVGNITATLHSPVDVYGVGVYHPPLSEYALVSPDSSPRRFAVYGWVNKPTVHGILPGRKRVVTGEAYYLGEFVYKRQRGRAGDDESIEDGAPALQRFALPRTTGGVHGIDTMPPFSAVTFAFLDNYGNSNYTCVYRLQVLGELSTNF